MWLCVFPPSLPPSLFPPLSLSGSLQFAAMGRGDEVPEIIGQSMSFGASNCYVSFQLKLTPPFANTMRAVLFLLATVLSLSYAIPPQNDPMGKTGGYPHEQTCPYWTDKHIKDRGPPPYEPPKDWIYNTGGGPVEGKVNVHLVPHTHDDTGWQVTVDQYFFQAVYYVIDTVVTELQKDPNRKFMYVEVGFFARWWDQQPAAKQEIARKLVQTKQLEFINGGWCMHDEASPYYVEMVDQTTRGHQWLKKHFGEAAIPRGTWQIDPFGHSNTEAWLLGAESGFESVFWGRTDYQDFAARKNKSRLEWIWEGSQSLGQSAQIFAGELYGGGGGGYGTWIGYDNPEAEVQDDPRRHDYNVDKIVDQFVQDALSQAAHTQSNHQMWACGSDFQYQNAVHWYHNLDKIIHYVNQNGTVNAFYSTPSLYVDQKKRSVGSWEKRYDDIFPLADDAHNYWSGYFTSRPALKRQVRFASNFLNAARQLEVFGHVSAKEVDTPTTRPSPTVGSSWTDSLEGTIGVATHHDGMSGTERQDVADDYALRISESHGEVEQGVAIAFQRLLGTDARFEHCNCNADGGDNCLNITVCSTTTGVDTFSVAAWNPLGQEKSGQQVVRIPVTGDQWEVTAGGKVVASQVTAIDQRTLDLPLLYINHFGVTKEDLPKLIEAYSNKATHVLTFETDIPPMGYAVYSAKAGSKTSAAKLRQAASKLARRRLSPASAPATVNNGVYELTLDPATGMVTTLKNLKSDITTDFEISWGWYNSSVGGCTPDIPKDACSDQKSGAYIFRPNTSTVFFPGPKQVPTLDVVQGPLVTEIYQTFSSWATHVIRLIKDKPYIEVEWTAGPIPIDTPWLPADSVGKTRYDNWGKEVIVKYKTSMDTSGEFYTDANGREMVKRAYNARGPSYPPLVVHEPVAGNYYPVNSMIAVQDDKAKAQLTVITDVSQGGASLADGEIELMVHRRIQQDDSRGVQEPLNETMCGCNDRGAKPGSMGAHGHEGDGGCVCAGLTMRGRHWIVYDSVEEANRLRRDLIEKLNFPPTLAFAGADVNPGVAKASLIAAPLPPNVKLMTLTNTYADFNDGAVLVRLAHLYSIGEHPVLSQPATVNLSEVFASSGMRITSATAMSLTGNQGIAEMDAKKFKWSEVDVTNGKVDAEIAANGKPYEQRFPFDPNDPKLAVTLRPMEVRTFFCKFE